MLYATILPKLNFYQSISLDLKMITLPMLPLYYSGKCKTKQSVLSNECILYTWKTWQSICGTI